VIPAKFYAKIQPAERNKTNYYLIAGENQ